MIICSLILILGFSVCGCKVQVFDLQPILATTEAPLSVPSESSTPIYTIAGDALPAVTNTPPIHLAPTRINESVPIEISDLVMINGGTGWGIGKVQKSQHELVVYTTNGGSNWKDVSASEAIYENASRVMKTSAYFLDSSRAWVIYWDPDNGLSQNGVKVWKTQDAGGNWKKITLPTDGVTIQYFRDVQIGFLDNQIGWIFAKLGQSQDREYIGLYTTHDGGETWTLMVSPDSVNLPAKGSKNGVVFRNAAEGWISGNNAKDEPGALLWRTTDGGNTWAKQILSPPVDGEVPSDLLTNTQYSCSLTPPKFVDVMVQYAWMKMVCQGGVLPEPVGLLYWTYDSGNSWRVSKLPKAEGSLVFYGIYQGWYSQPAAADSSFSYEIQSTSNGGQSWNLIAQTAWKSDLQFITQAIGWGVVSFENSLAMVKTVDGGYTWEQVFPMIDP